MSGNDYMRTTTYISITKQIAEYWEDYKSANEDEDRQKQIDEFKYFYGNNENTLCYYDFDIPTRVGTLFAQRFIIQKAQDIPMDMNNFDFKRLTNANGLNSMLLYWIMEDFDFKEKEDENMTG